jgi:hypothetical protein
LKSTTSTLSGSIISGILEIFLCIFMSNSMFNLHNY